MGLIHELVTVKKPGDKDSLKEAMMSLSEQGCDWNDARCRYLLNNTDDKSNAEYYSSLYAEAVADGKLTEKDAIDAYVKAWMSNDRSFYVQFNLDILMNQWGHITAISLAVEHTGG